MRSGEEAVADELADGGGSVGAQGLEWLVEELGEGGENLVTGEVAVAGAYKSGLHGVDLPGPPHAALLPQHDDLRIRGPGRTDGLLPDVGPCAPRLGQKVRVG